MISENKIGHGEICLTCPKPRLGKLAIGEICFGPKEDEILGVKEERCGRQAVELGPGLSPSDSQFWDKTVKIIRDTPHG